MAAGAITSIGLGSGLELQSILDQLREAEQAPITAMETKKETAEKKLVEFDAIGALVYQMKSHALNLSLESNFLTRSTSVSNEDVLSATVSDGAALGSNTLTVNRLALKSSWKSQTGSTSTSQSVYVPTAQESMKGFNDTDSASAVSTSGVLSIDYGNSDSPTSIDVNLTAGMTLDQVVEAINTDAQNGGASTHVTASAKRYATEQLSTGSIADPNAAMGVTDTLTVTYGQGADQKTIEVDISATTTLNDIVDAVNTDVANGGDAKYVTASADYNASDGRYYLKLESTQDGDGPDNAIASSSTTLGLTDTAGKYYLNIESTAAGSGEDYRVAISSSPTGLSFQAPDSVFGYQLANGEEVKIGVAADTTLDQLAALINQDEDNGGISASVIDDGTGTAPYRLVLTADDTGEDNRISITTALADLGLEEAQGNGVSLNAELDVNGVTYVRQSNTGISDLLPGITLNLKDTGNASINISSDSENAKEEIKALVDTYNELVTTVKEKTGYDEENDQWGILSDAYAIKGLIDDLNVNMGSIVNTGGAVTSLYDLGLSFAKDGTISLDEDALDQAMAANSEDIVTFFTGDAENQITGFGDMLNDKLRNLTSINGLITTEKDLVQNKVDSLSDEIEAANDRLDRRFEILTQQFVLMDVQIGKLNSEAGALTQLISSYDSASSNSSK